MPSASSVSARHDDVDAVRSFNRFYTRKIGVLADRPLKGAVSLTEGRILYELAHRTALTATALCRDLDLDQGYLSRILARFEKEGLLKRTRSGDDRRESHIALTKAGRAAFAGIDRAWQQATAALIEPLPPQGRTELVNAMRRVEDLLERKPAYVLRGPKLGDMGWLTYRHAIVYGEEFGWNEEFEALVAEILATFVQKFDPSSEACWIAEHNGKPVGSIFLVKESETIGRLRLLFVDPSARGLGIGRALVEACIARARQAGYQSLTLWTNDVLASARRIYEAAGFRLVREWKDRKFGKDLVGQDWDLTL